MKVIELLKAKLQEELGEVEEAITAAKNTGFFNFADLFLGKKLEVEKIIEMVKKLEKELPEEDVWIPVSSGHLPKIGQTVIASINPALDESYPKQPPEILLVYSETTKQWFEDGVILAWTHAPKRYQPGDIQLYYKETE
jgi:hypothetical protein